MGKVRLCETLKHSKHLCQSCIEALKQSETRLHDDICWPTFTTPVHYTGTDELCTIPNKATHHTRLLIIMINTYFGGQKNIGTVKDGWQPVTIVIGVLQQNFSSVNSHIAFSNLIYKVNPS